jgi:hypothetical protein
MTPLPDAIAEGLRVAAVAQDAGVTLRVTGGVGIALTCPSAASPPARASLRRPDLVGYGKESAQIVALLGSADYNPDEAFNALYGRRRLFFSDPANERQLDVFLDQIWRTITIVLGRVQAGLVTSTSGRSRSVSASVNRA